jgi:CHAD domain-containing protein
MKKKKEEKLPLKEEIKALLTNFDENAIHHLRLHIKKLKAALQLIGIVNQSFKANKKYGIIRPFYKNLGAIRDIHIQQTLFKDNKEALQASFKRKYAQLLTNELRERQDIALEHIDKTTIKSVKKVKKQIKKALKDLSLNDFKTYFKKRISTLKKTLHSFDFSEKKMHTLRKLIKEIKFNSKFKQKIAKKGLAKKDIQMSLLDDLQNLLGSWQDNVVLKGKLTQQTGLLTPTKGEKDALMKFKTNLEVNNELIKNSIKKLLKIRY